MTAKPGLSSHLDSASVSQIKSETSDYTLTQGRVSGQPDRVQGPMLALQLALLGFFVILTLNGDYDDSRVEKVLTSVEDEFSDAWVSELKPLQTSQTALVSRDLHYLSPQEFQEQVTWLFKSLLAYEAVREVEAGRLFEADIPIKDLVDDSGFGTVLKTLLADRLAESLKVQPNSDWWFELSVITHGQDALIPMSRGENAASQMLKMLQLNGVAPFMLSAGLELGNPDLLTFRFDLNILP